jgi:hypothetical protein
LGRDIGHQSDDEYFIGGDTGQEGVEGFGSGVEGAADGSGVLSVPRTVWGVGEAEEAADAAVGLHVDDVAEAAACVMGYKPEASIHVLILGSTFLSTIATTP